MAQTQSIKRRRKLLTNCDHQLLAIKEVLDRLLMEADSLPKEIKNTLVMARDAALKTFLAEQEKIHHSTQ